MFDLGTSFIAAVEREPNATAIVDGSLRLSYAAWFDKIRRLVTAFDELGLRHGDHLVVMLQNRWEMATLHWACQLAGIIITPLNWRAKSDELKYVLADAGACALVFQDVSAEAVAGVSRAKDIPCIAVGFADGFADGVVDGFLIRFDKLLASSPAEAVPRAGVEDWSLMLYTSGTTGRGKGVPRRHRAERAAAVAHVAQNQYAFGERTLGVMPLYHTMGVRSLLAMALVGGRFVCLPRFDTGKALVLIESEKIGNLYLVPTLYHDLLADLAFAHTDISSVRKLGFAGAPMTDDLLKRLAEAFQPERFVNHYGSSEIYTFTICQDAPAKPGSAGKAGLNQRIRVVRIGSEHPDDRANLGEEGQIVASLASDEAFEGYWRRPEADAKSLHAGWFFTGDVGYLDRDGDLFVTGRVDDMIISGGENIMPVEIESALSLHPAVAEVAVVGLPDERLGQRVSAFIKRQTPVDAETLDQYCHNSEMANFKRPRDYIFVKEIPKSPVGKILRRLLAAGEYIPD